LISIKKNNLAKKEEDKDKAIYEEFFILLDRVCYNYNDVFILKISIHREISNFSEIKKKNDFNLIKKFYPCE